MIKTKMGGIVIGGLAGYLILSKGIGMIERSIKSICTAREWKNYYKYGKDGNMVPPGYSRHTTTTDNGETVGIGKTDNDAKAASGDAPVKPEKTLFSDTLTKVISGLFDEYKAASGANKGQTEASGEENPCPHDCRNCTVEKCPFESMKNGGVISNWDENGNPITGRYRWNDGQDLSWIVVSKDKDVVHSIKKDADDKPAEEETEEKQAIDYSENPDGEFVEVKE